MKFLKYLLLFILLLVAGGWIFVSLQPGDYDVSRSKVIKAPVTSVFNTVNDLKSWENWGPWHDEDTTIVVSYGDKIVGVGASNSWTSKDGPGSMKTVNVVPNKTIDQKLQFGDYDPSDIMWNFEAVDEGTKVTWRMKEDKAPFIFKMFSALSGGWDAMLGTMEENGLNNLDKVVMENEKLANSFRFSPVSLKNLDAKKFIGYPVKMKIDHEDMTKAFMEKMPMAGEYAVKSGLSYEDFTPGAVYTKYDETTGITEFYIGLLLHKNVAPGEGMNTLDLPKGQAAMISKFGNYGNGDEKAHIKIDEFIKANDLKQNWPIWELYVNDPMQVKPQDIQTDIYYPVK